MPSTIDMSEHRKPPNLGNGAREALIAWQKHSRGWKNGCILPEETKIWEMHTDSLLAWLWTEGFKVVPLESKDGG